MPIPATALFEPGVLREEDPIEDPSRGAPASCSCSPPAPAAAPEDEIVIDVLEELEVIECFPPAPVVEPPLGEVGFAAAEVGLALWSMKVRSVPTSFPSELASPFADVELKLALEVSSAFAVTALELVVGDERAPLFAVVQLDRCPVEKIPLEVSSLLFSPPPRNPPAPAEAGGGCDVESG